MVNGHRSSVIIIGGGASGVLQALALMRLDSRIEVTIVEPRELPGLGVAYSTLSPWHLLNVPAGRMGAYAGDPGHFVHWCDLQGHDIEAESFAPRKLYGEYLSTLLRGTIAECEGRLKLLRDSVTDLKRTGENFEVTLHSGLRISARSVVLALGNMAPAPLPHGKTDARVIQNGWNFPALKALANYRSIAIAGSGLSAIDTVLELLANNFSGKLFVISRHGLLPRAHRAPAVPSTKRFEGPELPRSLRALLSFVHREIKAEPEMWRESIDALRPFTQQIWREFTPKERKIFLRHLATKWDNVRHRIAPSIASQIEKLQAANQLRVIKGRIEQIHSKTSSVELKLTSTTLSVDAVVNCTGPGHFSTSAPPLIRDLVKRGILRYDHLGLGIEIAANSSTLDAQGLPASSLYAIGPLCRGTLWESTAINEIRAQADQIAKEVLSSR